MLCGLKGCLDRVKHSWLLVFCSGLAVTLILTYLYLGAPGVLQELDFKIYDTLLRETHTTETTGVPVVVDLDERSLAEYGQWPWPRYRVALLLAKLQQAGALAVGLDIVFAEEDRTSPKVLQEVLRRDLNVQVDFAGMPDALRDNDRVLASVLDQGPFVLGYFFNFGASRYERGEGALACSLHPVSTSELITPGALPVTEHLLKATDVTCNVPVLSDAVDLTGFFNAEPDADGIMRKIPLLVQYEGKVYPNLSLATLMRATGIKQVLVKVNEFGIESFRLGKTVIPVDRQGHLYPKFRGGRNTFKSVSASKVLADKLEKDELKGKIIFIGTSAAGLQDIRAVPLDGFYPGVEVHATIVDNILMQDFLERPADARFYETVLILGMGLLATVLLTWAGAAFSMIPLAVCAGAMLYGATFLMEYKGMFISPLYPLLVLTANFILLTLIKFWREEGQKKFLHATFSSYLSPELIEEMFDSKKMPELGGEARIITAYFTDIQSFSVFSEKLTATQLVELLNEYLTAMTDILLSERGTLDKYEGDAIIAFVGAPMDVPDHPLRACRMAVKMQDKLLELREKWRQEKQDPGEPERNSKGLPPQEWAAGDKWPTVVHNMLMRIGVNSGEIVVGNMGSNMRMNYTMMGDSVNLAARLESGAKQYGVYTLVSEYTMDLDVPLENGDSAKVLDLVEARFLDNLAVVGKSEPVKVYELVAMKGELGERDQELFGLFNAGMERYLSTEWDKAGELFAQALKVERVPEGKTTPSEVFLKRCEEYKRNPPVAQGEKWDGVHRMTKK